MERESFEDEEVARMLNKHFIAIKVDREERPDIDHIYMMVCQVLTGQGGWPLTIIMTPDKKPFYAGTYFPKNDRMGLPGLMTILERVADLWNKKREELLEYGEQITDAIKWDSETLEDIDTKEIIRTTYTDFKQAFDSTYGGFGSAPKFPTPHNLYFLLRYWYVHKEDYALEMVQKTLDAMHRGGIYDHIGFGFSRYSTDRKWLIPHFEKMLYDNALLSMAYLEAFQALKEKKYASVAREIFTYVLRDMTSPEGGFYSAEDADSEGVEGKFYVWSADEVKQVLGEENGEKYCSYYDITGKGNFEGMNIPNLIKGTIPETEKAWAEECRQKLFAHREKRIHPYKDDKILTAWNGLMIGAMAMGGRVLGDKSYTEAAERAVKFIEAKLIRYDGRLMARYRDEEAAYLGYADDYAFLIWGLIELYETTYNPRYLQTALKLNEDLLRLFGDEAQGGLFMYGSDSEQLITRPKEMYDGAIPSGNSVAALNFLRLARLTGLHELEDKAALQFRAAGSHLEQASRGYTFMLSSLLFAASRAKEIIVVSGADQRDADAMLTVMKEDFRPFTISAFYSDAHEDIKKLIPFIENYKPVNGKATAYVCENFTCSYPVTSTTEFRDMLQ